MFPENRSRRNALKRKTDPVIYHLNIYIKTFSKQILQPLFLFGLIYLLIFKYNEIINYSTGENMSYLKMSVNDDD